MYLTRLLIKYVSSKVREKSLRVKFRYILNNYYLLALSKLSRIRYSIILRRYFYASVTKTALGNFIDCYYALLREIYILFKSLKRNLYLSLFLS
jgi:hypothetical protein